MRNDRRGSFETRIAKCRQLAKAASSEEDQARWLKMASFWQNKKNEEAASGARDHEVVDRATGG